MKNLSLLFTQLRNAYIGQKPMLCVKATKESLKFLKILKNYGFIQGISRINHKEFKVSLKYTGKTKALVSIHQVSKPSLPLCFSWKDLWKFHKFYGILILKTSVGCLCHHAALKRKLGGAFLCYLF